MDLGNYRDVPEVAQKAFRERGMQQVNIGDGVTRFVNENDNGVAYRFRTISVKNAIQSKAAKFDVYDEVEVIQWVKDRFQKPVAMVKELPPELLHIADDGEILGGRFAEAYKRFLEKKESPGLPLDRWGVLSEGQVASLASMGIFSVEQLASKSETWVNSKFGAKGFFANAWEQAVQYTNGKENKVAAQEHIEQIVSLQQDNSKLRDELEQLKQMVMGGAPKRKARRPRKIIDEVSDDH